MTSFITLTPFSQGVFDGVELRDGITTLWERIQELHPGISEPGVVPYQYTTGTKRQVLGWQKGKKNLEMIVYMSPLGFQWRCTYHEDYSPFGDGYYDNPATASGGMDLASCSQYLSLFT